jgi:hypothetical protein
MLLLHEHHPACMSGAAVPGAQTKKVDAAFNTISVHPALLALGSKPNVFMARAMP